MTNREIDALVAEKVMGFAWRRNKVRRQSEETFPIGKDFLVPPDNTGGFGRKKPDGFRIGGNTFYLVPRYSTDIAAAWQVVEELRRRRIHFSLGSTLPGAWVAEFGPHSAVSDSATKAICLAALKAVGASGEVAPAKDKP